MVPETLKKNILFKTDLKSILRGLNSLLGLNMSRQRLKSIRIFNDNVMNIIVAQIDLVKFILESDSLEIPDNSKGIYYNENSDEFRYINTLTGDPKEALFIFEDLKSQDYVSDLLKKSDLRDDKIHEYKDLLSAVLDASQVNNSLLFLYHENSDIYVVNRSLFPYPEDDKNFYYYTKVFKLEGNVITEKTNFIVVDRFNLTISSRESVSDADMSQMVLPVVHIRSN